MSKLDMTTHLNQVVDLFLNGAVARDERPPAAPGAP
jgi:hypothetical protein